MMVWNLMLANRRFTIDLTHVPDYALEYFVEWLNNMSKEDRERMNSL
jgi:hypothetical protein